MRYRLRTLLILLGVLPPVMAGAWFAAPAIAQAPDPVLNMGAFFAVIAVGFYLATATLIGFSYTLLSLFQGRHRFATIVALAVSAPILLWAAYEIQNHLLNSINR